MKRAFVIFLNIWFALYLILYFQWIKSDLRTYWLLPLMCSVPVINFLNYAFELMGREFHARADLKKIAIIVNAVVSTILTIDIVYVAFDEYSSLKYIYDEQSWMLLGFITALFSFIVLVGDKWKLLPQKINKLHLSKRVSQITGEQSIQSNVGLTQTVEDVEPSETSAEPTKTNERYTPTQKIASIIIIPLCILYHIMDTFTSNNFWYDFGRLLPIIAGSVGISVVLWFILKRRYGFWWIYALVLFIGYTMLNIIGDLIR